MDNGIQTEQVVSMNQQPSTTQVFSFDVFDTCVTRYCARPADLFERLFAGLLTQKARQSSENVSAAESAYELTAAAKALARSRTAAEKTARQQTTQDDITLTAIYQALAPSLKSYGLDTAEAESAEIELELAAVSPILCTKLRIQQMRSQGHKVIFISDMYLPGYVVRKMLETHGFSDGSDAVYVSADVGLTKGSGRLFDYVCDQLAIAPKQLHHTGDNRYADVRAAKRQGVTATHFTQGDPTRYECGFRAELVGDDWMRSHLLGLSRAIRLGHDTSGDHGHATLAADVLSPLVTSYLLWVLTTAKEMGVRRLYFADSGLLAIAQTICQKGIASEIVLTEHIEGETEYKGHRFILCEAEEQSLILSDEVTQFAPPLSYIESPIGNRKQLEGTTYLFEYGSILKLLFSALSNAKVPMYQAIASTYAAKYIDTSSGDTSNLNPSDLNMLRQYAINNAVRLLSHPTTADAKAIVELHATTNEQTLQIRAVRPWEVPKISKRLIKRKRGNSQNLWTEGAIALSPLPIRVFLTRARNLRT
ncbi:MAG: hypothetical protein ACFB0D_22250 [Phormidesmis sp.]